MATASKKRTVKQKEPVTYEEFRAITDLTQQPFPAEGGGAILPPKTTHI
jgi:hypothetical protein